MCNSYGHQINKISIQIKYVFVFSGLAMMGEVQNMYIVILLNLGFGIWLKIRHGPPTDTALSVS